jgi:hypothetical protein
VAHGVGENAHAGEIGRMLFETRDDLGRGVSADRNGVVAGGALTVEAGEQILLRDAEQLGQASTGVFGSCQMELCGNDADGEREPAARKQTTVAIVYVTAGGLAAHDADAILVGKLAVAAALDDLELDEATQDEGAQEHDEDAQHHEPLRHCSTHLRPLSHERLSRANDERKGDGREQGVVEHSAADEPTCVGPGVLPRYEQEDGFVDECEQAR